MTVNQASRTPKIRNKDLPYGFRTFDQPSEEKKQHVTQDSARYYKQTQKRALPPGQKMEKTKKRGKNNAKTFKKTTEVTMDEVMHNGKVPDADQIITMVDKNREVGDGHKMNKKEQEDLVNRLLSHQDKVRQKKVEKEISDGFSHDEEIMQYVENDEVKYERSKRRAKMTVKHDADSQAESQEETEEEVRAPGKRATKQEIDEFYDQQERYER